MDVPVTYLLLGALIVSKTIIVFCCKNYSRTIRFDKNETISRSLQWVSIAAFESIAVAVIECLIIIYNPFGSLTACNDIIMQKTTCSAVVYNMITHCVFPHLWRHRYFSISFTCIFRQE